MRIPLIITYIFESKAWRKNAIKNTERKNNNYLRGFEKWVNKKSGTPFAGMFFVVVHI